MHTPSRPDRRRLTPAEAQHPRRTVLGPAVLLAMLGIVSGTLAIYLTLRVPNKPFPAEIDTRVSTIQKVLGPASTPGVSDDLYPIQPQTALEKLEPGRPRAFADSSH